MNDRLIIHVDMDAFFTSVEQHDQPELRGRPVMVGGSTGRGVVAAASYEARQYGVRSAMPAAIARRLCPEGVFLPSRMARYREVSETIFNIFFEYASAVEGVSIDEAYLDATDLNLRSVESIERLGRALKRHIQSVTGLTASVGLSHNKLLAKLASDYDKPDGLVVISGDMVQRMLDPLPVRRIPGVGPATSEKLTHMGILTIGQLRHTDAGLLAMVVGDFATSLLEKANGIDHRPVEVTKDRRSVSQETTFEKNITSIEALIPVIEAQAEKIAMRLDEKGLTARAVSIKIRSGGFSTLTRASALSEPTARAEDIARTGIELLREWAKWRSDFSVRLIGLGVSMTRRGTKLKAFRE